jgi:hypothetical protein
MEPGAPVRAPGARVKPVRYYVLQVGNHWEVSCSRRDQPVTRHPDRRSALRAAQDIALQQWQQHQVATEVLVNEGDAGWHQVAGYGSLLGA